MRFARVHNSAGHVVLAAHLAEDRLVLLDGLPGVTDDIVDTINRLGLPRLQQLVAERVRSAEAVLLTEDEAIWEVPVPRPQKIFCVALNYLAHAAEGDQAAPTEPVIFFKPPSALVPNGATVCNPRQSERLDYEVELAVVIGTRATNVVAADWRRVVCGYTVFNDVTARDMQLVAIDKNQPWDHSKGFDTFAPCGPYLVTADDIPDPIDLALSLHVDDEVRQASRTSHMIFDVPTLIETLSSGITLEPGDIIATGTPSGIGPVASGQVMTAEVEGIGRLVNPVVYERQASGTPVSVG